MSSEHILPTKLVIPSSPLKMVSRARLMPPEQAPRIVLVSAPAGYGKTTLISSWARYQCGPVAWLSMDAADNDPIRFLMHLITAIQARYTGFGKIVLEMLGCTPPAPVTGLMRSLVIQLCELPGQLCLILDDLHVIDSAPVQEALAFLIDHQPPQLQLVLASRCDPPFSLARMRALGHLLEYRAADLRFTLQETETFCNDVMQFDLPQQQIATLAARTEGWIVGLQLAAVSLRETEDKTGFIDSFAGDNRHITDFLLDEVLRSRSRDIQDFLLHTSLLERFNASLCNAITGREDSRTLIEELERSNMFILSLDRQRIWYRYHHLFTSLLQSRLRNLHPELVHVLHKRATHWFSENKLIPEAVHHAIASGDHAFAADLIERHTSELLIYGQIKTTLSWSEQLPASVLAARPALSMLCAWSSFFMDDLIALDRYIRMAEQYLSGFEDAQVGSKERAMLGQLGIMRGCQLAYSGNLDSATVHLHGALASFSADRTLYGVAAVSLGVCYFVAGKLDEAQELMQRHASIAQVKYNILVPITAVYGLGRLHMLRGNLLAAKQVYNHAMHECQAAGWQDFPACGMLHIGLGELAYEMNDLTSAEQLLQRGIDMTASGMQYVNTWARILLARVRLAQGLDDDLLDAQSEALLMKYSGRFVVDLPPLSAAVGRLWLAQGRFNAVVQWKDAAQLPLASLAAGREPEYLVLVRYFIAARQAGAALALLDQLWPGAEEGRRGTVLVEILILKAIALQAEARSGEATEALQQALTRAEHTNLLRLFINDGAALEPLLKKLARRTDYTSHAHFLLGQMPAQPANGESHAIAPLAALFSKKEKEVVIHMTKGGSKREIADAMFISYNTLNSHTKSIYAKLGVNTRMQAVERLRKLGFTC